MKRFLSFLLMFAAVIFGAVYCLNFFHVRVPVLTDFLLPLGGGAIFAGGFFPQTFSTDDKRALYQWLRSKFPSDRIITEGDLQLIVALANSQVINFNVLQDGTNNPLPGETRLQRSDSFWAVEHGFAIGRTATAAVSDTMVPEYYPNSNIFTVAAELAALQALYFSGKVKITVNSVIYFNQFKLTNFENAKVAQSGLAASAAAAANLYNRSDVDWKTAYKTMTPHLFLNGGLTNELSVTLAQTQPMAAVSPITNWAIYRFRGFYITGGALTSGEMANFFAR